MREFIQLFQEQVYNNMNKVALRYLDDTMTYKELDEKSNIVANSLDAINVNKDEIIPIIAERSIETFIGILGIIKYGACYLPIDPEYPTHRVRLMIKNSKAKTILMTNNALNLNISFNSEQVIIIDNKSLDNHRSMKNRNHIVSHDLCKPMYLIYTSGTINQPKGVLISQESVMNFIYGMKQVFNFEDKHIMLSLTTISFDIFVFESLLPLAIGMQIVIVDPMNFYHNLNDNKIDIIQTTPTTMNLILGNRENLLIIKRLKYIILGGEEFPSKLLSNLKKISSARIFNAYGPSETTVWSSIKELTDTSDITIGCPILNTEYVVIRDNKKIGKDDIGVKGELLISGKGLALGYFDDEINNNKKFIKINYNGKTQRYYKTGDIVKYCPKMELIFVKRNDLQIKIRGYRVELKEIEEAISEINEIKFCCVVKIEEEQDEALACYYMSEVFIDIKKIYTRIENRLPQYMIPQHFYRIDKIPLMPNGKLNRNSFTENNFILSYRQEVENSIQSPLLIKNKIEKEIYNIWCSILGEKEIDIGSTFFELGGTSLSLARMHNKLIEIYPNITINDIFANIYISDLAHFIEKKITTNIGGNYQ